jgi:calcium-dependent protein kinase
MGICASKRAVAGADPAAEVDRDDPCVDRDEPCVSFSTTTDAGTVPGSIFFSVLTGAPTSLYDLGEMLGQGSYGSVSKGVHKLTKKTRAVKIIDKTRVQNIEIVKREVSIMKDLDHPSIIRLFETFEDHDNVYLVMELCTGGELFDRVVELGHLTEVQAASVLKQILGVVSYLHENKIIHRDIKPENFLFLHNQPVEKGLLKLINFAMCCPCEDGQTLSDMAGTPYYVSPQVLQGRYDKACDLWSCGVIMYILLCGFPPFHGETDTEVLAKVRQGNFTLNSVEWKNISKNAKDLVGKLLEMNPKKRYTADQGLNHAWMQNNAPRPQDVPSESGQGQQPAA